MSNSYWAFRVFIKSYLGQPFFAPQLALPLNASGPTGDLCSPHPHAAALEGTEVSPMTGTEWLHHRLCHKSLAQDKEKSLVGAWTAVFYSLDSFHFLILLPSSIQCKGDNNLTWLHLHWQKRHIIIFIWQRTVARWQAQKLPTLEGGGSLKRETAEGITFRPWCHTACTNNISHKSKEIIPHRFNQVYSRGSTHWVQIHRAAGIRADTQSQQQLTMRAMNRPKSCTAGI